MNPEEDGKSHGNGDTRVGGQQENNDNRSTQREQKPCQPSKMKNRFSNEQFKLNNNVGDNNGASNLSSVSSHGFANGSQLAQNNTLGLCIGADFTNTNSLCPNYSAVTPSHMHSLNTNKASSYVFVCENSSSAYLNSASSACGIVENGSNKETDMRNNVDYGSGIEKCPAKVSCGMDNNAEPNAIWTSSSFVPNRGMNNIGSSIGSTSQGTCCFLRPNINGSREVAGPSGLQRVGP